MKMFVFFFLFYQFSDNCWMEFRKMCFKIVYNPFSVLFVMVCIILNTLCMAFDQHNMSRDLEKILVSANYVSCCKMLVNECFFFFYFLLN